MSLQTSNNQRIPHRHTCTDKAPQSKQQEIINMRRNKTPNSKSQTQESLNPNSHNNTQIKVLFLALFFHDEAGA